MIGEMSLQEVATPLAGQVLNGDCRFTRVCTDTRSIQPGDLFVALRGPNFDAHDFLQQAADAGACGLVVERANASIKLPQCVVKDGLAALGQLGTLNRERFKGTLVAVTGSGGKTTVKTMLNNIFAGCGATFATRGNLNNHIGVPLSLLELNDEHEYAVIEMGASGPGEIAYLVELARPQVGLVTNALRAHVEGFGSLEGVARAKGEMFAGLPEDGTAVVNTDDPLVDIWRKQAGKRRQITFSANGPSSANGLSTANKQGADVVALDLREGQGGGVGFTLQTPAGDLQVDLQLIGRHNVVNATAAAAVAHAAGVRPDVIKGGLEATRAVAGRMQLKRGIKGATIIDDSYNANPDSARAAVDSLVRWPGTKVLVFGQMAELGADAERFHYDLGVYAQTTGVNHLVTVGGLTRKASEAFGYNAHHFDDCEQAIAFLQGMLDGNTVALIKGSRSARMERVVTALSEGGEE